MTIKYNIKVDPEFESLIPPLSEEEFKQLRDNIVESGECHDPILIWNEMIVDGHNRWKIIQENPDVSYQVREMVFLSRNDAMAWMIRNQLGRRNLPNYERAQLALRLKETIAAEAKAKQSTHTEQGYQKSDKAVDTNKELAKVAGVSHDTIHKVDVIEQKAPEEIKEQLRRGEVSINKAYNEIRETEKPKQSSKISGFTIVDKPPPPKKYSYKKPKEENSSYDPAIYSAAQDRLRKTIEANFDFYVGVVRDVLKREKRFVTDDLIESEIEAAKNKLDMLLNDYYQQKL